MAGIIPLGQSAKLIKDPTPEELLSSDEMACILNTVKNTDWTVSEVKRGRDVGLFSRKRAAIVEAALTAAQYDVNEVSSGAYDDEVIVVIRPIHLLPLRG